LAWLGVVRLGTVWHGKARFGAVWLGSAGQGRVFLFIKFFEKYKHSKQKQ
jgi:hypothetical protein